MHLRSATFALAAVLPACASPLAHAQAQPTAVATVQNNGLNLGLINGTFHYGGSVSEVFQTGYAANKDVVYQTNLSGNVAYSTKSEVRPFSLIYSGGVQFSNLAGYGNSVFQSLALSQGYNTRDWTFGINDVVSYLPQSPTVGLSGIPGAGDIGLYPVTGVNEPSQNILTYNSNRVSNTVAGTAARRLTSKTSLSGEASSGLIHFFNNSSFDSNQLNADVSINHTISARTSVGVGVTYTIFGYDAQANSSFQTRGVSVRGQHQLTRALSVSGYIGPQWVSSSQSLGIPSRLTVSGGGGVTYNRRFGSLSAFYSRGVNGGSGVLPGAISDSFSGAFSRTFGRDWAGSINAGYSRTNGLASQGGATNLAPIGISNYSNFDSTFAGAQVNRRLSKSFSAFASYSAANQSYGNYGLNSPGALNGLVQSFAIGVSFYPRSVNLGQF